MFRIFPEFKGTDGSSSWEVFKQLLHKANIVGIPGNFFGSSGEGFLRISTLCSREEIEKAMENLDLLSSVNEKF
ncbi:MAG: aminotransferase class I/II-fold pyridoxal phosphate-dependent enzyme [Cyanobacteria bacterium J06633_8]